MRAFDESLVTGKPRGRQGRHAGQRASTARSAEAIRHPEGGQDHQCLVDHQGGEPAQSVKNDGPTSNNQAVSRIGKSG